jgi:hypothetical protein
VDWEASKGTRVIETVLIDLGADLSGWISMSAAGLSGAGKVAVGNGYLNGEPMGWIGHLK